MSVLLEGEFFELFEFRDSRDMAIAESVSGGLKALKVREDFEFADVRVVGISVAF